MIVPTQIAIIYSTAIVIAAIIIAAAFLMSRRYALQNQAICSKELHHLLDRIETQERALVQHVGELHRKINHHVERLEEALEEAVEELDIKLDDHVKRLEKGPLG